MENEKKEITEIKSPKPTLDKNNENKSVTEQAKDYVGYLATEKAVQDESLVNKVTSNKKKELENSSVADLKKEQSNLQEAEFGVYKGIADYAGIKRPLPQKYQKWLFTFYMILLFPFQLTLGSFFCIANYFTDCVDSFISKLSSVAKSAKILVVSVLTLSAIAFTIYIVVNLLQKYNIIG